MDQIIPGLWIGDLACALATDYLATAGITHIVTALKQALPTPIKLPDGRTIEESQVFNIHLDDIENAPILVHFPGAVEFIDDVLQQEWLEDDDADESAPSDEPNGRDKPPAGKKRGQWATMGEGSVLVHCHAGISRSVAVTCAYLMHTRHLTVDEALKLVQSRRAIASPNAGFMHQLELYEAGGYEVDVRHQRTRRFLMSQASILRGNPIDDVMLSYYPSPLHSPAASSSGGAGDALHFTSLDGDTDGKGSSMSGSSGSSSRVMSRRNSRAKAPSHLEGGEDSARSDGKARTSAPHNAALSTSPPISSDAGELLDQADGPATYDALTEELIKDTFSSISDPREVKVTVTNGALPGGVARVRGNEGHVSEKSRSQARERQIRAQQITQDKLPKPQFGAQKLRCKKCRRELAARDHVVEHEPGRGTDAFDVRKRQKDVEQKSRDGRAALGGDGFQLDGSLPQSGASSRAESQVDNADTQDIPASLSQGPAAREYKSVDILSASLPPQLAALRLGRNQPPQIPQAKQDGSEVSSPSAPRAQAIPAIARRRMLHSPLCTSYFVEPLAWMSALQNGEVAGRLDCPSTRCGAKLGSWDWAGMQCACGAWVTPAFALHKSKVDEV